MNHHLERDVFKAKDLTAVSWKMPLIWTQRRSYNAKDFVRLHDEKVQARYLSGPIED